MPIHIHICTHPEHWKEAIANIRIRRYAPSSRFRFRRRDRNAYIPSRRREREKGGKRDRKREREGEGSFRRVDTGRCRIDSAHLHVCARSRARAPLTRVCTRDSFRRVRAAAFKPRSRPFVVYPVGVDVIPIYSVPSPFFHPSPASWISVHPLISRHLSSASRPRADISFAIYMRVTPL